MSVLKSFDIVVVADSYQASHYWGKRKFTGFKYSHNELLQGDQELYRVTCSTDKRNYFTDKPITSLFSASDLDHPPCLYTSGKYLDRDEVLQAGSRRPQRLKARHIDSQYEIKSGSDNVWIGFNWQGIRFYWEQCDGTLDEAITRGVKQWPFGHKEYKHPTITPGRHTRYDRDAHYKLVPMDTPNVAYAVYISKETNLVSTDTWHVGELDSKKCGMQKRKGLGRIDFFAPMGPELEQLSLIVLFGWLKHMAEMFASQGGGTGGGGGAASGGSGGGGGCGGGGGGGGGGCGGGGGTCGG